jgi:hypothetical protein
MNDQIAHIFFGFMLVSMLAVIPAPSMVWAGAVLGGMFGLVRELGQAYDARDLTIGTRRLVDIFFWACGGALAGYLR